MGRFVRFLVLIAAFAVNHIASAQTIAPGEKVDDFSLPAANGEWGQRLAEQKGLPVMLIWTDRCDRCEERLSAYQLLAESHQIDGLVSWVIWTPDGNDAAPKMRIPVLKNSGYWNTAWQFEPKPAVMLINRDGVLDYLFTGPLSRRYDEVESVLSGWLAGQSKGSH